MRIKIAGTKGTCLMLLATFVLGLALPGEGIAVNRSLKVGVIISMSGQFAEYGQAIVNGLQMAEQSTSPEIKFLIEDAQSEPRFAVSAFHRLVETEKVDLIYVWGVAFCQALAPLAERRAVPLIAQCVNDDITRNSTYVLRFMNHAGEYASLLLDYLRKMKYSKLDIIAGEQPYVEDMHQTLRAGLKPGETIGQIDRHPASQTDFRSSIVRLKNRMPDALGVYLMPGQIASFYRQLAEQRLPLPTFGINTFENQSEVDRAAGAMEGVIFANHHVEATFRKFYQEKYGNDIQITWAALAFEFRRAIDKLSPALLSATNARERIDIFAGLPEQSGEATGRYAVIRSRENGIYFRFPLTLKTVKDSRIVEMPESRR